MNCFLFFCIHIALIGKELPLPDYIDLNYMQTTRADEQVDLTEMGYHAFNSAPEFTTLLIYLKDRFELDAAIETGTYWGGTTRLLSLLFDEVYTIELSEPHYVQMAQYFARFAHVHCHLGSSESWLAKLLPTLKDKRLFFYLDAHGNQFWPLIKELTEISKTHRNQCIIMLDDIKVPGRKEFPYDKYNGQECSYEFIKNHLNQIFSDYTIHYILPRNRLSHAKLVIIPKVWATR